MIHVTVTFCMRIPSLIQPQATDLWRFHSPLPAVLWPSLLIQLFHCVAQGRAPYIVSRRRQMPGVKALFTSVVWSCVFSCAGDCAAAGECRGGGSALHV